MAFFSDTTNAPKIIDGRTYQHEFVTVWSGGEIKYGRLVTTESYRFTWLTEAAADTIATSKNSETNTTAAHSRMSDNGAYQVNVTVVTKAAWDT